MFEAIIAWVISNGAELVALLFAVHAAAAIVVNLTPTPADNAFLGKVYKGIEFLAGIVSYKAKTLPGESVEAVKAAAAAIKRELK